MNEQEIDQQFLEIANRFIEVANEYSEKVSDRKVGMAFLYASARFNAYIAATSVANAEELGERKTKAVDYFSDRYGKLLEGNMEDYIANFEEYVA